MCEYDVFCTLNNYIIRYVPIYEFYRHLWPKRWTTRIHSLLPLVCWRLRDVENLIRLPSTEVWLLELILYVIWISTSNPSSIYYYILHIFKVHYQNFLSENIFIWLFCNKILQISYFLNYYLYSLKFQAHLIRSHNC